MLLAELPARAENFVWSLVRAKDSLDAGLRAGRADMREAFAGSVAVFLKAAFVTRRLSSRVSGSTLGSAGSSQAASFNRWMASGAAPGTYRAVYAANRSLPPIAQRCLAEIWNSGSH